MSDRNEDGVMLGLCALSVLSGSFLLFLVQPIVAKELLPWFGGAASVWAICLVFFQLGLLAGYAYADLFIRRLAFGAQLAGLIAIVVVGGLSLPIVPGMRWRPLDPQNPSWQLLGALAATVGIPYVSMAATTPLVQSWFARRFPGRSPYPLFALSNLASMLALLAYPALIERELGTKLQAYVWSTGYVLWAVSMLLCLTRLRSRQTAASATSDASSEAAPIKSAPGSAQYLGWIALAALGSFLLVAVTSRMTRDIAAIPLLWTLPLAIYLLTFIIAFQWTRWLSSRVLLSLAVAAAMLYAALAIYLQWPDAQGHSWPIGVQIGALSALLGCACLFCHGRLALSRPAPTYLTRFYLTISAGGAFGAVLIALVAPALLNFDYDLEGGMTAVALALLLYTVRQPRSVILLGIGVCVLTVGSAVHLVHLFELSSVGSERNFYGVLRIYEQTSPTAGKALFLSNGATLHGMQYEAADLRERPTEYYGVASGVGRAIAALRREDVPRRIGVIGLGAGTLAAYGRAGDTVRFYELNPAVLVLARKPFNYLNDSHARIEVALGDARLSLQREPRQGFDLLVVDAFSSDAIPVHLLTVEALALYLTHLKHDGLIAFHTSNRYLDLPPVIARIAQVRGLEARIVESDASDDFNSPSTWVLLSRELRYFERPELASVARTLPRYTTRPWTDDYSDPLEYLH
jgi:hypothetical protein